MKLKKIAIGLAMATSLASNGAFAEGPNPFTDCGIGAALFKNDTAATISNVIWDLGTTALISATASPDTCEGAEVQAAAFILESYDTLAEETAKGTGAHLNTLMSIVRVDESQKAEMIQSIRSGMSTVVASDAYLAADKVEKANLYYNEMMKAIKA